MRDTKPNGKTKKDTIEKPAIVDGANVVTKLMNDKAEIIKIRIELTPPRLLLDSIDIPDHYKPDMKFLEDKFMQS